MYSKLQNVNIGFLDSPETRCLHSAACCTKKYIFKPKIGFGNFFSPIKLLWSQIQVEKPIFYLANISDTPFHQKSPFHWKAWFLGAEKYTDTQHTTDITTYKLKPPRDRFSENKVK